MGGQKVGFHFNQLIVFSIFCASSAFAGVQGADQVYETSNSVRLLSKVEKVSFRDGIYQVSGPSVNLIPEQTETLGQIQKNSSGMTTLLSRGEHVAISMKNGLVEVTVAVEDIGGEPNTFYFTPSEIQKASLTRVGGGTSLALYAQFAKLEPVQVAGACKRLVERRLGFHVAGLCSTMVSDSALARVGFVRTSCDSAILSLWAGGHPVRGSGGQDCGHMAYRSGSSWSSGDFHGDPGNGYHSQRCYARVGNGHQYAGSGSDAGFGWN